MVLLVLGWDPLNLRHDITPRRINKVNSLPTNIVYTPYSVSTPYIISMIATRIQPKNIWIAIVRSTTLIEKVVL